MLNRIVFYKLFGIFNYDINLKEGGVTILTGPNGFGKSTILKTIHAFNTFDIMFFSNLDFKKILFYSKDYKEPVCIKKNDTEIIIDSFIINTNLLEKNLLKKIKRPYIFRVDDDN
ncbi:ATP-binding cassette domain-containing protein [Sharpea azabuensis]|uniref:ATP-binding cassette domain-containing protein n=1 Tax=Sharpea azabuensis TaxID=322505 RepID=UPI00051B26CA|nr:ATP-binding cassette domain-containing protein [Sharpea azabuensis]